MPLRIASILSLAWSAGLDRSTATTGKPPSAKAGHGKGMAAAPASFKNSRRLMGSPHRGSLTGCDRYSTFSRLQRRHPRMEISLHQRCRLAPRPKADARAEFLDLPRLFV